MLTKIENMIKLFKALGDFNRLKIIRLFASSTINNVSVTSLAEKLAITQPATSQHLKILKEAGLIKSKKEGLYRYYFLDIKNFKKQKKEFDDLFALAFTKCPRDNKSCSDCKNKSC